MPRTIYRPCLESLEDRWLLSTVTNLNDDGSSGSLRSAIANTQAGGTVDFAPGLTGVITLTGGELLIAKNLTVQGPGAKGVAISANSLGRVLEIASNTEATISGLTISGGQVTGDGTDVFGGGVLNNGTLHLNSCVVSGNAVKVTHGAGKFSAMGGGISSGGTLTLDGTTVNGNTADGGDGLVALGGGIFNTGSLMITSGTIVDNTTTGASMNFNFGGGIGASGNITLFSTTVARNRSATAGGGISLGQATIMIRNSLIALNTAGAAPDIDGTINTADHDLLGTDSGTNIHNGQNNNRTGTGSNLLDPKLGMLQDNGGPVPTVALLSGSRAIDAGTTTNIPAADQRGFQRVVNNTPDVGAYEFQPPATVTSLSVSTSTPAVNAPLALTITVQGTAPGSNGASGTVGIFDGNVQLGTANLTNGQATFSAAFSIAGSHNLSARFPGFSQGDYRLDPSSSNPVPVNVGGGGNGGNGGNGGPQRYFAVAGAGRVQLRRMSDGALLYDFAPYGNAYTGPVTVAVGDIHHNGFPDLVTGTAAGNPHVKVFDGKALANGTFNVSNPDANALASFFAYGLQFNVGVNVAVADIENNGFPDIVTGATAGNPDVRVYRGKDLANGSFNPAGSSLIAQWFAFGLNFNVGANVAAGNVSGNGFADVVVGATNGNPNVKVYNGQDIAQGSFDPAGHSLMASFFPFALGEDTGAFVAAGDVNGDGFADVIAGAAIGDAFAHTLVGVPIATALVGVYNGHDIANNSFDLTRSQLTKFSAYALGFHGGVSVGAQVFDSDGKADIVTGASSGASHFRVVDGLATGILPPAIHNLEGFANDIQGGISVGA